MDFVIRKSFRFDIVICEQNNSKQALRAAVVVCYWKTRRTVRFSFYFLPKPNTCTYSGRNPGARYFQRSISSLPRPRAHVLAKDDNNTAFILTSCHDASLLFLPFFSACLALLCPALPAHFFLSQVEEEGLGSSGTSNYNLLPWYSVSLILIHTYMVKGLKQRLYYYPSFSYRDSSVCAC